MKPIIIKSIEHKEQRYDTVGDWFTTTIPPEFDGILKGIVNVVRVSKMSDERYELLVAIHELVEKVLCDNAGITEQQVDEFDMKFEELRGHEPFGYTIFKEPGDDPRAPYHRQHKIADVIERLLAIELGVNWETYNDEVNSL